ncbi:MAG: glutathione S-transferase [Gammaproteobacteria bacterium]|jgi:glutathione S-transferase
MKLYTTLTSPYGRIARMVIIAKGLQERVPIEIAKTRQTDSPYYDINPSGRVPFLLLDDGPGLEESSLVSLYLDELDGAPTLHAPPGPEGLEARRIEAVARSMLDGVSLWGREFLYRPAELHSPRLLEHERERAFRLLRVFENAVDGDVLIGPLNMAQLTLAAIVCKPEGQPPGFDWRDSHPRLAVWADRMSPLECVMGSAPPPA